MGGRSLVSGTGVLLKPHFDSDGKTLTVEHWQDAEDIIERNKELQKETQRSDWGRHVATIPNVILVRWMNEENVNIFGMSADEWGMFIKRKLSDPDWRHLRTDCQANQ